MASQAKYTAAANAMLAVVKAEMHKVGGFAEMEANQYMSQITAVINEMAKAGVDAADGVDDGQATPST